jgi:hypothetical protein
VIAVYTKTGGKNGRYSWVPSITNISSATTLHVRLFRCISFDWYSRTHNDPVPGMNRFEVIAPWQFLCTVSTPKVLPGGEVVLEDYCDRETVRALTHSTFAIGTCVNAFVPKRGARAVQEEGDDAEA